MEKDWSITDGDGSVEEESASLDMPNPPDDQPPAGRGPAAPAAPWGQQGRKPPAGNLLHLAIVDCAGEWLHLIGGRTQAQGELDLEGEDVTD